jgi:hypothetical protein
MNENKDRSYGIKSNYVFRGDISVAGSTGYLSISPLSREKFKRANI